MKYYLYHIKGKKIGVTSNPEKRIHKQQGYKPGEYEIVLETTDIDHVSRLEIELQKKYNYKVDQQLYKNLKNKNDMKVNVTEQTTTFDVPVSKLKGRLMDIMGLSWETHLGEFELTIDKIPWIMKNTTASMYNNNRCFIYNKAFYEEFYANKTTEYHELNIYDLIRDWATEKGIYKSGDAKTQYVKLMEEAGELAQAILKNDEPEVIDAIGDMVVVLTNLAKLRGHNIEDCITSAYNVIKSRTGKMVDGTFQKD